MHLWRNSFFFGYNHIGHIMSSQYQFFLLGILSLITLFYMAYTQLRVNFTKFHMASSLMSLLWFYMQGHYREVKMIFFIPSVPLAVQNGRN